MFGRDGNPLTNITGDSWVNNISLIKVSRASLDHQYWIHLCFSCAAGQRNNEWRVYVCSDTKLTLRQWHPIPWSRRAAAVDSDPGLEAGGSDLAREDSGAFQRLGRGWKISGVTPDPIDYSIKQDSERQKSPHSSLIMNSEKYWSAYKPDHEQWRRLGINPNTKHEMRGMLDPNYL
jgi:hypothetical protein